MAASYNQIVLFGDSLIQMAPEVQDGFSFQSALQTSCMRRLDTVNRGFSGWNTDDALRFLPDIFPLPPSQPKEYVPAEGGGGEPKAIIPAYPTIKYLLVLFGANDACLPIPTNKQGVPLERYKANVKSIITHPNITVHKPKILLVTPPPLDQTRLTVCDTILNTQHKEVTRHAAVSAMYSEAARQVAAEVPGTVLIDLQKALMDKAVSLTPDMTPDDFDVDGKPLLGYPDKKRGGLEQLLPDGLHLSGDAYRVFYDLVKGHFGPFPGILDTNMDKTEFPNALPGWAILHPLN